MISLVGAGPGDPELLTVRGLRRLQDADVVVHDALVGTGVLDLVRPDAELIDVGKRAGQPVPQDLINALLVQLGTDGTSRNIVRLKGGDPFVFGRGGEEALALAAAGLDFEIVPAAAGIPVTHRGVSASFTVVTGHRQPGQADINWHAMAQVGGTLVILMGVAQRASIAAALMAGGLPPHTPVAAVRYATSSEQEVVRCRLDQLATTEVRSPATLVIGEVAAFDMRSEFLRGVLSRNS
jgi:uroporphyrin-III C-methyltransferase